MLLVTQTNPTTVWEGITQGREYQEVGITGGPRGAQSPPWLTPIQEMDPSLQWGCLFAFHYVQEKHLTRFQQDLHLSQD